MRKIEVPATQATRSALVLVILPILTNLSFGVILHQNQLMFQTLEGSVLSSVILQHIKDFGLD